MTSDSRQTMQEKIRLTVDEETERVLDRILEGIEDRFEQLDKFQQSLEIIINQIKNLGNISNKLLEFRDSIENKFDSLKLKSEFSGINTSLKKIWKEVDGYGQATSSSFTKIIDKLDIDRTEFTNTFELYSKEFKSFREKLISNNELLENVDKTISVLVEASANHNKNTEDKLKSNGDIVSNVQTKLNKLDKSINCMNDDIQEKLWKFEEEQNDLKNIISELSDKLTLMKSTLNFIALPWWKRIFRRNK